MAGVKGNVDHCCDDGGGIGIIIAPVNQPLKDNQKVHIAK